MDSSYSSAYGRRFLLLESRRTADRPESVKEISQVIERRAGRRMFGREIQRRLGHREKVCNGRSRGAVRERRGKSRLILPRVVSERRISNFIEVRGAFKRAVEDAPTSAKTCRTGFAQNLAKQTVIVSERIRQAQPRRKVVPTRGRQRARNAGIPGNTQPVGEPGKTTDCSPGIKV